MTKSIYDFIQYRARNKEDGLIYYLRPIPGKEEMYFVFKHPHFSDRAYCGAGYCHHYEILERMEEPKVEEIGTTTGRFDAKKENQSNVPKADPPKPKQMNLLAGLTPKAKPVQMKLF